MLQQRLLQQLVAVVDPGERQQPIHYKHTHALDRVGVHPTGRESCEKHTDVLQPELGVPCNRGDANTKSGLSPPYDEGYRPGPATVALPKQGTTMAWQLEADFLRMLESFQLLWKSLEMEFWLGRRRHIPRAIHRGKLPVRLDQSA